jgi:hypothetical protein
MSTRLLLPAVLDAATTLGFGRHVDDLLSEVRGTPALVVARRGEVLELATARVAKVGDNEMLTRVVTAAETVNVASLPPAVVVMPLGCEAEIVATREPGVDLALVTWRVGRRRDTRVARGVVDLLGDVLRDAAGVVAGRDVALRLPGGPRLRHRLKVMLSSAPRTVTTALPPESRC